MIAELKRSRDAIEEWTQTLEHRVQERTRELQQVQDQLIHAGKMAALGELAAGVAHEINNPLTGVLTFSSLLLKKVDENHPWRKDLETIVQQTSRCRNIVKGLLDFARQRKPDKRQWDIHTLLERTISLVEKQAPFQNIQIVKEFKTDLPMLYRRWGSDSAGLYEHHPQRRRCHGSKGRHPDHSDRVQGWNG